MSDGPLHTRLLQVLGLLYRMQPEEVNRLADTLLEQRKAAWRASIREDARRYGYTGPVNDPRREDLAELRRMSREDAQSIANTWRRDAERQLRKLYDANPKGNRAYYIKRMEEWATARDAWKAPQIATQTEQTTRSYAQDRFRQENGLRGGYYRLVGPPPVCEVCVAMFAEGVVDQQFVDRHPAPFHIGCPHEWQNLMKGLKAPPPQELWVG